MNDSELKFRIGDDITNGKEIVTVIDITTDGYGITNEEIEADESYVGVRWYISFDDQDKWELV